MMKPLSQYKDEQLQLVQPSIWKRVYELRTPDTILYTMHYPKLLGSLVIIEGFGEKWEVYRPKWWSSTMEIRKEGTQLPIAKFVGNRLGGGGVFELPMGERVQYRFSIWKGTHELQGEHQQQLILFKRKISFKSVLNVVIEKQSPVVDKYPWLAMVVYRIILEQRSHAGH